MSETNSALRTEPWSVAGHVALVSGGGSGIGLAFVQALVQRGCRVLIADLALRPESEAFIAASNGAAVFHPTDVTVWTQLESAVAAASTHFGRLDIVCPCAGVFEPSWSSFWNPPGSPASQDSLTGNAYKVLDVNLTHPIRLTQLALAHFLTHKIPGRVLHISSIAAQGALVLTPMYCASKAAISAFVRSLAQLEPHFGIRVNGVAPGVVRTPLWTDPQHADKLRFVDESQDQWVTPEEVAVAMVNLLEAPEMVGGTILEVGAGNTRMVTLKNDPGPEGPGLAVSRAGDSWEKLVERLRVGDWGAMPK